MLIFVSGPAGCGKSSVGEGLASKLNCPFIEGDSYHPKENVDKMSRGIPLTDEDRWDWLGVVARTASQQAKEHGTCVASCSALKEAYRTRLREEAGVTVGFVFLVVDFDLLLERLEKREGHFMKASMIRSQVDIMEVPKDDKLAIVFHCKDTIDATVAGVHTEVEQKWLHNANNTSSPQN